MRLNAWIDRLAVAELILAAVTLPIGVASLNATVLVPVALAGLWTLGLLVVCSGALFAASARMVKRDIDAKGGGGVIMRDGKVVMGKRQPHGRKGFRGYDPRLADGRPQILRSELRPTKS